MSEASSDLAAVNPLDPETLQCPYPHYARMRDEAPVMFVKSIGSFMVTRHDLVLSMLRDPDTYSSRFTNFGSGGVDDTDRQRIIDVMDEGYARVPTMLTVDIPEHTRYRRLVAKAFTPKVIAELEPEIRAIASRLADDLVAAGSTDFVTAFAVPLPVAVIARALNVPDSRLEDFKRWSDDSIAGIGTALDIEGRIAAERGVNEFQHYFADQIEQRRTNPQGDILTGLLNARVDDNDPEVTDTRPLDMPEMLGIVQQLLVAGNETTTKLLSEMMMLLGQHPEQWTQLQNDPSRIPLVVEEALRMLTPTQGMWRVATRDHELAGVHIPKGARLVAVFASANRDEALFPEPDEFNPDREKLRDHLAFGKGIHFCIGANLSRLEARVALEELLRRVDTFSLDDDNDLSYHASFILRGLQRLDLSVVPKTG